MLFMRLYDIEVGGGGWGVYFFVDIHPSAFISDYGIFICFYVRRSIHLAFRWLKHSFIYSLGILRVFLLGGLLDVAVLGII